MQINKKYIEIFKNIYHDIQLDKKGTSFPLNRGVKQGDPASPYLFNAVLEQIFKNININGATLSNLQFADDIVLFAESANDIETMLDLTHESRKAGLEINLSKTKAMTNRRKDKIQIYNQEFGYINEYTYLVQIISLHKK